MIHPKTQSRILELDVLRGLAAICVVSFHYTTDYTLNYRPSYPMPFHFPWGAYGVQLFFMISGYVIFMTLEKTTNLLDFIISRFSRLFPAYWVAIILTFTTVSFFHLPGRESTFKDAIINLTMLQDWFGASRVDNVYWTLTVEISFYVVMGILYRLKLLKYIEMLVFCWVGFMYLNVHILILVMHIYVPVWIKTTGLLRYGSWFFAGILFYNLKNQGNTWTRYLMLLMCLVVQYTYRQEINPFGSFFLFVLFYFFIFGQLKWTVNPLTVFLGSISYPLYLIHQNIGYMTINYLYKLHLNSWLIFIIPVFLCIAIASAISFGIEKPAMRFIRQKYGH